MLKISTQGKLDDDYTLHLQSELTFEGINDNIYRGAFAQCIRDYRQEFVSSVLKKALPGAELESLEVFPADVRNLSETFKLKLKYDDTTRRLIFPSLP